MPLVSVITRTKNRNLLLKRAIKSVFDQTFQDFEMVIVNDGGDKHALEAEINNITGIDKNKIKLIHNDTSKGMEAASNIGIKNSDSKYILIHDDDDTLHHDFLKEMLPCLETNENKKGVVCWSTFVYETIQPDSKVKFLSKQPFNHWLDGVTISSLLTNNMFPTNSFLYKREVLKEIGLYDESLPTLGDWDFNIRFILRHDIFIVKKELCYYHHRLNVQSGSLSNSVIGGSDAHKEYNIYLRNKWLREDLTKGKTGFGVISSLLNNSAHLAHTAQSSQNTSIEALRLNIQIFWASVDMGFTEGKSSYQQIELHDSLTQISFALPNKVSDIEFLRLDIGNKICLLNIHSIEMKDGNGTILWKWNTKKVFKKNDLLFILDENHWPQKVVQLSTSDDPHFIVNIGSALKHASGKVTLTFALSGLTQQQLDIVNKSTTAPLSFNSENIFKKYSNKVNSLKVALKRRLKNS